MSRSWKRRLAVKNLGFVKTFTNFSRSTQIALFVMFAVGWSLLFICGYIDLSKPWWHGKSYIPNICAALTSFLIGAPVGLTILDTFTGEREEKASLARVNSLTKIAWNEYTSDVYRFCTSARMAALKDDTVKIQIIHDDVLKVVGEYRLRDGSSRFHRSDGYPSLQQEATDEEYDALLQYLRDQIDKWQELLHRIHLEIPPSAVLQIEWSAILTSWSTLDQYIRLQRMERRLRWFERSLDSELRDYMAAQSHPLKEFSSISDSDGRSSLHNMTKALEALRQFTELSKQELDHNFLRRAQSSSAGLSDFPWQVGIGYLSATEKDFNSLNGLRTLVERIEADNWPDAEKTPVDTDS